MAEKSTKQRIVDILYGSDPEGGTAVLELDNAFWAIKALAEEVDLLKKRIDALEARPANPDSLGFGAAGDRDPLSGMRLRNGD